MWLGRPAFERKTWIRFPVGSYKHLVVIVSLLCAKGYCDIITVKFGSERVKTKTCKKSYIISVIYFLVSIVNSEVSDIWLCLKIIELVCKFDMKWIKCHNYCRETWHNMRNRYLQSTYRCLHVYLPLIIIYVNFVCVQLFKMKIPTYSFQVISDIWNNQWCKRLFHEFLFLEAITLKNTPNYEPISLRVWEKSEWKIRQNGANRKLSLRGLFGCWTWYNVQMK